MAAGIFISYRRSDSAGFAGRLYDQLAERYGRERIFMDIDAIPPGRNFADEIARALARSRACVVVIGRSWVGVTEPGGDLRLEDPEDFVRLEVASAIRRGVTVIPVLVDGASPPSSRSLPEELRPVARLQAIELSNQRWAYDMGRLIRALDEALEHPREARDRDPSQVRATQSTGARERRPLHEPPKHVAGPATAGRSRRRLIRVSALVAAGVLLAIGLVGWAIAGGSGGGSDDVQLPLAIQVYGQPTPVAIARLQQAGLEVRSDTDGRSCTINPGDVRQVTVGSVWNQNIIYGKSTDDIDENAAAQLRKADEVTVWTPSSLMTTDRCNGS